MGTNEIKHDLCVCWATIIDEDYAMITQYNRRTCRYFLSLTHFRAEGLANEPHSLFLFPPLDLTSFGFSFSDFLRQAVYI